MLERIIDISERGVKLRVENRLLIMEAQNRAKQTVPLSEVGVLLLANPASSLSAAVLNGLAENGAATVICNEKFLPSAMLLPLASHHETSGRMQIQAEASAAVKRRAWRQIVQRKIRNQGALLKLLYGEDYGLGELAKQVGPGDAENLEGRAARLYWAQLALMEKRDHDADDANRLLNYGYTVLMAACARAICCAGLHPTLGMHHCNIYNPFCLASDLMEPYRPLIDCECCRIVGDGYGSELTPESKRHLIGAVLNGSVEFDGKKETVFRAMTRGANSYFSMLSGECGEMRLPELNFGATR